MNFNTTALGISQRKHDQIRQRCMNGCPHNFRRLLMPHKGLKSPKRFTNLPLGSMSSILNLMGLMHSGVPRTPRSYNALIEVFKFIWDVETPIKSDPYLSQSHQDWGLWTFSSKVAECVSRRATELIFKLCWSTGEQYDSRVNFVGHLRRVFFTVLSLFFNWHLLLMFLPYMR